MGKTMNWRGIVPKPEDKDYRYSSRATTRVVLEAITQVDKEAAEKRCMRACAHELRGSTDYETARNIREFVKSNIRYVEDTIGHERVKVPNKTLYDGFADCKSMSILVMDLLRENGIKGQYRLAAYANPLKKTDEIDFSHIYSNAIIGGKLVSCDTVPYSKFDNEVYYLKKQDVMAAFTTVSIVRGLRGDAANVAIPQASFLNWSTMTDGEMRLQIVKQQLELLAAAHPDSKKVKDWVQGIGMINDTIYKGVHGLSSNTNWFNLFIPKNSTKEQIAKVIQASKKQYQPANHTFVDLMTTGRKDVGIGADPLIQLEDINTICEQFKKGGFFDARRGVYVSTADLNGYNDCLIRVNKDNNLKGELNQTLEKTAAKYLYEYITPEQNAKASFATKVKISLQKGMIPNMQFATKLSSLNLREWSRLGVMRQCANKNAGALQPEQCIDLLKANPTLNFESAQGEHIGFAPIFLIVIIIVAAKAVGGLIQICKDKEPTAFQGLNDIAQAATSAMGTDWAAEEEEEEEEVGNKGNTGGNSGNTGGNSGNTGGNGGNTGGNGGTNPPPTPEPSFFEENKNLLIGTGLTLAAGGAAAYYFTRD